MGVSTATDTLLSPINTASLDLPRVHTAAAPVRSAALQSPERPNW